MIRMVIDAEVVSRHEDVWEDTWRTFLEKRREYPGFRWASILRDSEQPTHYLVLSDWDGHDQLGTAMRAGGLAWMNQGATPAWTMEAPRIYDEIAGSVGDITDADGTQRPTEKATRGTVGRTSPTAIGPRSTVGHRITGAT